MKRAGLPSVSIQIDRNDRIARLVHRRAGAQAEAICVWPGRISPNRFVVRLPTSRRRYSPPGRYQAAATAALRLETLDRLTGPDWYAIFKDLHAGLILDAANKKEAGKRYERAYKADSVALRTVQAYGRYLSRNASKDDALKIYQEFNKAVPDHPVILQEMKEITAGEKLPSLADSAQAGAAEALYGLGASIGRRGGEDLALVYLQLALYLEPTHADGAAFARRSLRVAQEAGAGDQSVRSHSALVAAAP